MWNRGISLLEVLVAIFVLSIGLLGVAAMIPIGKHAMNKMEQSDRTGILGRAALRDLKIRGMLDYNQWSTGMPPGVRTLPSDWITNAFVIDPLGYANGITGNMGPLARCTILTPPAPTPPAPGMQMPSSLTESIFVCHDDLVFNVPEERTMRPTAATEIDPGSGNTVISHAGHYSYFLTVNPPPSESSLSAGEWAEYIGPIPKPADWQTNPRYWRQHHHKTSYAVNVVVCRDRNVSYPDATANVSSIVGSAVTLGTALPDLKTNDWVMLTGQKQVTINGAVQMATLARWYRIVSNCQSMTPPTLGLNGPDWDLLTPTPATPVTLVVIDGVTGVYSETVTVESSMSR